MLSVNKYSKKYIGDCQDKIARQLTAYKNLITTAGNIVGKKEQQLNTEIESFEPVFFNNMLIAMDAHFVHRTRAQEGKDGNPLNEVRILCNSIMNNNSKMIPDKTIKYDPAKSILKYKAQDEIKLSEADFIRLYKAFFAGMIANYS